MLVFSNQHQDFFKYCAGNCLSGVAWPRVALLDTGRGSLTRSEETKGSGTKVRRPTMRPWPFLYVLDRVRIRHRSRIRRRNPADLLLRGETGSQPNFGCWARVVKTQPNSSVLRVTEVNPKANLIYFSQRITRPQHTRKSQTSCSYLLCI